MARDFKYERCDRCGGYDWVASHKCSLFFVNCAEMDGEDDWSEVWAKTPEKAVEKWAEDFDQATADYSIVGGRIEPIVKVHEFGGVDRVFRVAGEAIPHYYTKEIKEHGERSTESDLAG